MRVLSHGCPTRLSTEYQPPPWLQDSEHLLRAVMQVNIYAFVVKVRPAALRYAGKGSKKYTTFMAKMASTCIRTVSQTARHMCGQREEMPKGCMQRG